MAQIILVSSFFQALTVAALQDEGVLAAPGLRQILVIANNSPKPEIVPSFESAQSAQVLIDRFDQVVSLNEAIWPVHPRALSVKNENSALLRRHLSTEWGIADEPHELVVESFPNAPGGALARVFRDASISMIADGLMSYGPLRNAIAPEFRHRLGSVYYTDLIPGLRPVRLGAHAPAYVVGSAAAMKSIADQLSDDYFSHLREPSTSWPEGSGLILAQYLADLGAITKDEELELHRAMVDKAAERGLDSVVFKPHPAASPALLGPMRVHAKKLGLRFMVESSPASAEILINRYRPAAVISCFSTALATAGELFGAEPIAVGTEFMLERFAPYENSNRVPVTIADAVYSEGSPIRAAHSGDAGFTTDLQKLINAVSYCMQPVNETHLRTDALEFLEDALGTDRMRYFKYRRLTALDLPGARGSAARTSGRPALMIRGAKAIRRTIRKSGVAQHPVARRARALLWG